MANLIDSLTAEDREKYGHLIMRVDTDIKLKSVILSDENSVKIKEFLSEMEHLDTLLRYKLNPMNRLLFYGASGCGKTYLAKALANHLNYYMLYVDIAQALSDGSVATSISDIFLIANKYKRCIIFFDEADSIAWNRDSATPDSGVIRRATNSIFQQLDQMDKSNVFISATNMLHRLDVAFENRFNLKLEFRRPELNVEETAKKFLYPGFELEDDTDSITKGIIDKRCKLSYRELTSVVERAMKKAVIAGRTTVYTSDLYKDVAVQQKIKIQFGTDVDNE